MKTIAVLISGRGGEVGENLREVELAEGTTAADVLVALGLPRTFLLSKYTSSMPFADDENLYGRVEDGEKLKATPQADVGGR